jgi:hypothetical protein
MTVSDKPGIKHAWEYNIKTGLKILEWGIDWLNLAHVRDQCVVDIEMSLRIL